MSVSQDSTLVIGLKATPPFIEPTAGGRPSGLSHEFWEMIDETVGAKVEYQWFESLDEMLKAVAEKEVDMSINPITVTELCDAVHVSRRTLQYTFESCCDISPKQFIQSVRLNQVRRVLQDTSDQRCINEIAFDFGFFHLGHFCQSYKQLFGESPMQTRSNG